MQVKKTKLHLIGGEGVTGEFFRPITKQGREKPKNCPIPYEYAFPQSLFPEQEKF